MNDAETEAVPDTATTIQPDPTAATHRTMIRPFESARSICVCHPARARQMSKSRGHNPNRHHASGPALLPQRRPMRP